MDSSSQTSRFEAAKQWIDENKSSLTGISQKQQENLYAYFKQAQVGDNPKDKPWPWEMIECHKWEAWNRMRGTSKEKAMEKYMKTVEKLQNPS